jgi:hypothetical protein
VKASLLVDKIAEREAIAPTNDEVDAEVQRIAKQQREPVAAVRKKLQKDGVLSRIAYQIRSNKTLNFLFEHARKEAGEPEPRGRTSRRVAPFTRKKSRSPLALSVGAIVANIYYVQPLLAAMARTFSVSVEHDRTGCDAHPSGHGHRHADLRSAGR